VYLDLLYRKSELSDEEAFTLISEAFRIARSSICSIRDACIKCELVEKAGPIRKSALGRDVATWMLTPKGRAAQAARRTA